MPNDPAQNNDPSAPVDAPTSLPDLPHDIPAVPSADISPESVKISDEVPDPTSPPPANPEPALRTTRPGLSEVEGSFVPPTITPPTPSRSKAKIVGALLAILILGVSIPAGIFLVQRSQEIREKAECDPTQCVGWEQVNGACNSWEQVNGACNGWDEGPCDENDPETGECTHHAQGPCNSWEQVNGDCNGWEQVNGACNQWQQCPGPIQCDDYQEQCGNGGVKICHQHEDNGQCVFDNCDACQEPYCGDGVCTDEERSSESCAVDCGEPPPTREACTYNEVCPDEEGGGIRECHGSKEPDGVCEFDEGIDPACSECEGDAVFSGSCSVGDTGNGSFSYSCQINCTGTAASCNQILNLSSSWFHCKSRGGGVCTESSADKDNSGTPSLSNPTITAQLGSASVSGNGTYSASSCGRSQFDVAINDKTNVAGGVHDNGSDCSVTCASQGFWCANNAAQCGAPHVRHSEFSCDQPSQACCELKDTGTTPTAQCTNVKVYDSNGNQLSATQLTQLKAGDSVKLAINGSASSGTIDKARFRINAGAWQEATAKNSNNEYFINYTVSATTTNFQVEGMIHHQSLNDWF